MIALQSRLQGKILIGQLIRARIQTISQQKEVHMTVLQMFHKGTIKPGCLIKCVKNVGVDKAHRIFVKGRPYRVLVTARMVMALKSEGGYPVLIQAPTPGKRNLAPPSWTSFGLITG